VISDFRDNFHVALLALQLSAVLRSELQCKQRKSTLHMEPVNPMLNEIAGAQWQLRDATYEDTYSAATATTATIATGQIQQPLQVPP
jgi:hypothetical protein